MASWRSFLGLSEKPTATFSESELLPTDQLLGVYSTRRRNATVGATREEALTVPAVLRARNMICHVATLPIITVDGDRNRVRNPLFEQIDPAVINEVTLSRTLEDLFFDQVAWWEILEFAADGYPMKARQVDCWKVKPDGKDPENFVWIEDRRVPTDQVIRFDSLNPGLLNSGGRAIRKALDLDATAAMYAKNPRPLDYISIAPGQPSPFATIEEAKDFMDEWDAARQERTTALIPEGLIYNTVDTPTPAEMQLVESMKQSSLDLANATGLAPEDMGVPVTSRTYANISDQRQDRINEVLAPYMLAVTSRLSMGDVTKRGYKVRFDINDYMKPDPVTRVAYYKGLKELGSMTSEEIREEEGMPEMDEQPAPPRPAIQAQATVSQPRALTAGESFAADDIEGVTFQSEAVDAAFSVDEEKRTITGLAIPWGEKAYKGGRYFYFKRGGQRFTKLERVKLLEDHDWKLAFGRAIALKDTPEGLLATFKVARGEHGDRMLQLAADGAKDGMSVGVVWDPSAEERVSGEPNTYRVTTYNIREVSQLGNPAFDSSRLTSVVANSDEGEPMDPVEQTPAAQPGQSGTETLTLSRDDLKSVISELMPSPQTPPASEREVVPAHGGRPGSALFVQESLPYRFSYESGRHHFRSDAKYDFSSDLFDVINNRDHTGEAEKRVNSLISAAFDVDRADTAALSPNRFRPDLWQPQMDYATPLWDMINSGDTDGTPFDIPKFSSASGLVGPATEGTEPAPGAMVLAPQTITPTQVWGKVEMTRQAARRLGRPELSGIIWDQMLREYYEDREAAVATFLNTLTAATDITVTGSPAVPTNDNDQTSVQSLEAAIADLQFARGGNRFRAFAVHQFLYRLLARVTDDAGRPLYPQINPMNANGTAESLYAYLNIAGTRAVPAYALGAASGTTPVNSWLFDPAKVRGWASAPERLDWNFGATIQTLNIPQLSHVTIGIYGDIALANLDINGVRQVIFDPNTAA